MPNEIKRETMETMFSLVDGSKDFIFEFTDKGLCLVWLDTSALSGGMAIVEKSLFEKYETNPIPVSYNVKKFNSVFNSFNSPTIEIFVHENNFVIQDKNSNAAFPIFENKLRENPVNFLQKNKGPTFDVKNDEFLKMLRVIDGFSVRLYLRTVEQEKAIYAESHKESQIHYSSKIEIKSGEFGNVVACFPSEHAAEIVKNQGPTCSLFLKKEAPLYISSMKNNVYMESMIAPIIGD